MSAQNKQLSSFMSIAKNCFSNIAPSWTLKNLIAVNPLQGFENMPIEEAMKMGNAFFEASDLPEPMCKINIETIKWLQLYSDEGQATIKMPSKEKSFYLAFRDLAIFDDRLHQNSIQSKAPLNSLPENSEAILEEYLKRLDIEEKDYTIFLTLLLTTLPGWASYIKYKTEWSNSSWSQVDYLAVRIVITYLLWPNAKDIILWHNACLKTSNPSILEKAQAIEVDYRTELLHELSQKSIENNNTSEAQWVFCIDVRSEPFRHALESVGHHETFGFAGFFGIPASITNNTTGETHASCPVLLKPKHSIVESPCTSKKCLQDEKGYQRVTLFKKIYQSLKYNFTTPFSLVEALGVFSGLWMGVKTFSPTLYMKLKYLIYKPMRSPQDVEPNITSISYDDQALYAESVLRMIGLTRNFSPMVIFCGHGSHTENNAYSTALDCGACGGHAGGSNAKILAAILNQEKIRKHLADHDIHIPNETIFIAAEHNTTTDEVTIYNNEKLPFLTKIKNDLQKARDLNNAFRLSKLNVKNGKLNEARKRAYDWAQVRPEWGLTGNAAFIIAPRELTRGLHLEGRCFLHSYDYKEDTAGNFLRAILTAPVVVAQWINMQYFFSTINNVAYGGGSKITKNITGKIGIMQGNASDLMTGLPLQSLHYNDSDRAHIAQRLQVFVLAHRDILDKIIKTETILERLFGNGWIHLISINPEDRKTYLLNRDFSWQILGGE